MYNLTRFPMFSPCFCCQTMDKIGQYAPTLRRCCVVSGLTVSDCFHFFCRCRGRRLWPVVLRCGRGRGRSALLSALLYALALSRFVIAVLRRIVVLSRLLPRLRSVVACCAYYSVTRWAAARHRKKTARPCGLPSILFLYHIYIGFFLFVYAMICIFYIFWVGCPFSIIIR